MSWRIIESDTTNPYYVTAIDDAISNLRTENKIPNTVHFYRRNPPAISVGRSRKIKDDVNITKCKKNNIKIIRRTTGGGSIFTDNECLIYSLIFNISEFGMNSSKEIFENVCKSVVNGLRKINIYTEYKSPNDILLNKKKVSGAALIFKKDIVLIHGTILYNTNLELMDKVLKRKNKTIVTTICKEIDNNVNLDDIKDIIKKEFQLVFDTNFKKEKLTSIEKKLVDELLQNRYHNDSWNFKR